MNKSVFSLEGLTKPLSKLIEAVQSGIGVFYEPTQILRKAKAEAEAAMMRQAAQFEREHGNTDINSRTRPALLLPPVRY